MYVSLASPLYFTLTPDMGGKKEKKLHLDFSSCCVLCKDSRFQYEKCLQLHTLELLEFIPQVRPSMHEDTFRYWILIGERLITGIYYGCAVQ